MLRGRTYSFGTRHARDVRVGMNETHQGADTPAVTHPPVVTDTRHSPTLRSFLGLRASLTWVQTPQRRQGVFTRFVQALGEVFSRAGFHRAAARALIKTVSRLSRRCSLPVLLLPEL